MELQVQLSIARVVYVSDGGEAFVVFIFSIFIFSIFIFIMDMFCRVPGATWYGSLFGDPAALPETSTTSCLILGPGRGSISHYGIGQREVINLDVCNECIPCIYATLQI